MFKDMEPELCLLDKKCSFHSSQFFHTWPTLAHGKDPPAKGKNKSKDKGGDKGKVKGKGKDKKG